MVVYSTVATTPDLLMWRSLNRYENLSVGAGNKTLDLAGGKTVDGDTQEAYRLLGRVRGTGSTGGINPQIKIKNSDGNYYNEKIKADGATLVATEENGLNYWTLGQIPDTKDGILHFDLTIHCYGDVAIMEGFHRLHNITDLTNNIRLDSGILHDTGAVDKMELAIPDSTADVAVVMDVLTLSSKPTGSMI